MAEAKRAGIARRQQKTGLPLVIRNIAARSQRPTTGLEFVIAHDLTISIHTVHIHLERLYRKAASAAV